MELERAFEILGLAPGASAEEIESAYRRLRDDLDARVGRVRTAALRAHYARLRQHLDPAREAALAGLGGQAARSAASRDDAFATLGLAPGASALDVASAYVTLCEELEREVASAPSQALRMACVTARAEIDAAYQRCAAQPLRTGDAAAEPGGPYETQLASEPFEAPREKEPSPVSAPPPRRRAHSRRRGLARFAVGAGLAALLAAVVFAVALGVGTDPRALTRFAARFTSVGPPPELVEARSAAEYMRRRIGDERRELQTRVEENRTRVTRLEEQWTSAHDAADFDRMAVEIGRARARAELTEEIAALAESHIFSSAEVAVAYGKVELGDELMANGDVEEATQAFEAAWLGLDQALQRLDLAEEAVGARSEAEAALEAWQDLARGSGLDDGDDARLGREVLARGRQLLQEGAFAEAVPDLRGAARHFSVAVGEGRKRVAESSEAGGDADASEPAPPDSGALQPVPSADASGSAALELAGASSER
jgi:hypothetical protein